MSRIKAGFRLNTISVSSLKSIGESCSLSQGDLIDYAVLVLIAAYEGDKTITYKLIDEISTYLSVRKEMTDFVKLSGNIGSEFLNRIKNAPLIKN